MMSFKPALMALVLSAGVVSPAWAEDALAPLSRELNKMGNGVCRSLKLDCKKAPAKARPSRAISAKKPLTKPTSRKSQVAVAAEPKLIPVPRPKPQRVAVPRQKPAIPKPAPKPSQEQAVLVPPVVPPIGDDSCVASLTRNGVDFEPVATPASEGNCRVEIPVRLRSVETSAGRIALPEGPVVGCRFALQFSLYLKDMGAAAAAMDKRVSKLATGPGFVCRGRNGDASGKLSEHAYGNALDITTIGMASGETIKVADALNAGSPSHALLRDIRARACGYFSTVLGPGANAAHAEHFHFDMGTHGKSNTYKICE